MKNYVGNDTIGYITKYMTKLDEDHTYYKAKILTSAGIGRGYEQSEHAINNKFNGSETIEWMTKYEGGKVGLPIYWRNKIYSEEEREKLWIIKLDREIRYVRGIEIDISKGEEEYYAVLEYERKKSIELGYGTDKTQWDRKEYEERRRELMMQRRIK